MPRPKTPKQTQLSASQLKTFTHCPRKWAWRYIAQVPEGYNPAAALGTRVHKMAEEFLTNGTPPDESEVFQYEYNGRPVTRYPGRILRSALDILPSATNLTCEGYFSHEIHGQKYRGYMDITYVDPDGVPVVADIKTTSNIRAYGLTEKTLPQDYQALIYSVAASSLDTPLVRLEWLYMQTKPQNGSYPRKKVTTTIDLSDPIVEDRITDMAHVGQLIQLARRKRPHPTCLPPVPSACSAYGGCPYQKNCNLTVGQILQGDYMEEHDLVFGALEKALGINDYRPAEPLGLNEVEDPDPVNPPEAPSLADPLPQIPEPAPAVVTVPEGGPEALERADLRDYCVQIGVPGVDAKCRYGKPRLLKMLRAFKAEDPALQESSQETAHSTVALEIVLEHLDIIQAQLDRLRAEIDNALS